MEGILCGIYRIHIGSDRFRPREISRIGYDFLPEAVDHFLRRICQTKENSPDRIFADTEREAAGEKLMTEGGCGSDADDREDTAEPGIPQDCRFAVERKACGKPFFPNCPEIKFNISNSGEWIYIAVSTVDIGIDIQIITGAPLDRIAKRVFGPEEYDGFMKRKDQRAYFFREWVLRESYIKWTGEGLARDMRNLPHDAWQLFLPVSKGYEAAITAAEPLLCVDTEIIYDRQKGFIWKK